MFGGVSYYKESVSEMVVTKVRWWVMLLKFSSFKILRKEQPKETFGDFSSLSYKGH